MTTDLDILTGEQATTILLTCPCTVKLNISTGTYKTRPDISFDLIFVEGFNEWTHLHNIASIEDELRHKFIPIDWTK